MKETILGNFTALGKFPLDCETLASMQSNIMNYAVIAMIAGKDQLILSGCKVSGSRRTEGYVYIKSEETPLVGEILYHPESVNSSTCYIAEQPEDVTANGEQFTAAYTKRWLADGIGTTSYAWNNFADIASLSNTALKESLNTFKNTVNTTLTDIQQNIESIPQNASLKFVRGMIMMWSGSIYSIPNGWALCNGSNGTPDLRGRFILGAGSSASPGNKGGSESHYHKDVSITLTANDIPAHRHPFSGDDRMVNSTTYNKRLGTNTPDVGSGGSGSGVNILTGWQVYNSNCQLVSNSDSTTKKFDTTSASNMPPYYALAFIMKL